LHVADIDFDFAGALTGPNEQNSLTLVLEDEGQALFAAQRRLQAFAVVLERAGSRRPINVVVLSEAPDPKALSLLEEVRGSFLLYLVNHSRNHFTHCYH